VRLPCRLREIRGRRKIKELAEDSGIAAATLRLIESGRQLPLDKHVAPMEQAYGQPFERWYEPELVARRLMLVVVTDLAESEAA
jgi:transcriptional regulator with XRE-family HTH domain